MTVYKLEKLFFSYKRLPTNIGKAEDTSEKISISPIIASPEYSITDTKAVYKQKPCQSQIYQQITISESPLSLLKIPITFFLLPYNYFNGDSVFSQKTIIKDFNSWTVSKSLIPLFPPYNP